MARYNEILTGRFNRFAQKIFSMKGPASLVSLGDELQGVFPFFNGVENRYLESWESFGVFQDQTGAAASNSGCRLRNPSGSNVVGVVYKIQCANPGASVNFFALSIVPGAADLGTLTSTTNRRFDNRGRTSPTLIPSQTNNVAAPSGSVLNVPIATNGSADFILTDFQEIPILPGDALHIASGNQNFEIMVSWWWRERFLEDSERF